MQRLPGGIALAALAALIVGGCAPSAQNPAPNATTGGDSGGAKKLVIAWAQWDPAVQLDKLCDDYTKETGVEVEIQQIPWSDFETKVKTVWQSKGGDFDMVVGDSQWLGTAAEGGHYVDLTDWSKENVNVADMEEAAVKAYGEYDGKLYALPCMADAIGFAYRKDLFNDPKNAEAFKAKYGADLKVPETWDEFKNIAEFFTKPDGSLYGAALFYSKNYDGAAMGFQPFLWSYGGDWSNINSPEALKGLDMYVGMKKFTPPGSETFYFDECLREFQNGKVAMTMSWFAFFPGLVDKTKNKFADNTGYFMIPAGPKGRFVSLGGQGISISAYGKNQEESKKFVAWLSKETTQAAWAKLGGLTANKAVAASADYMKATPYNAVFSASAPFLKDFDNGPNYSKLLNAVQTEINGSVAGIAKPADALKTLADQFEEIKKG